MKRWKEMRGSKDAEETKNTEIRHKDKRKEGRRDDVTKEE